jgi:hypothetical protein
MIDMKSMHTNGLKKEFREEQISMVRVFMTVADEMGYDVVLLKGKEAIDNVACLTNKDMCISVRVLPANSEEELLNPRAYLVLDTATEKTEHETTIRELISILLSADVVGRLR